MSLPSFSSQRETLKVPLQGICVAQVSIYGMQQHA
jgi:hypothetical protein